MAPLARPVDPKLQQDYLSAARRLSHTSDATPAGGSSEPRAGLKASTASKDAVIKDLQRVSLSRGSSPVPESILEAAARRLSRNISGTLSTGQGSPVNRSPRGSRSPRASNTAVAVPCTPPASLGAQAGFAQHGASSSQAAAAAGGEAPRRRFSMTSNDGPPSASLQPYLAAQQVGDFCQKRANEKAALVQYMQSRSHAVGAVLGMRPSSTGPSEQTEVSPSASRSNTMRAPGEFITASTAPMPRRESLQSYLDGQQPLNSMLFDSTSFVGGASADGRIGSGGVAGGTDLTFTTSGRLESHWTDTEVLLTTRGSWQAQNDPEVHGNGSSLASTADRSGSRHSVVKGSVQRRLSSADALGEVATLHSTKGEVRSLLVQEARARLATAEAARPPAAAGTKQLQQQQEQEQQEQQRLQQQEQQQRKQQEQQRLQQQEQQQQQEEQQRLQQQEQQQRKQQQQQQHLQQQRKQQRKQQAALTTDDSEDWRETRAAPADAVRRKHTSSSRPAAPADSGSEEEVDVHGRNAARMMADWYHLKRSSQGGSGGAASSSSSDGERRWKDKKNAGAPKAQTQRRNSSSSSSSSDGSWFTTLAARRLVNSSGGAAKVAVQSAAQRYSRAKDMANADGGGRARQPDSSRQIKSSSSSAGRLQRARPKRSQVHHSTSSEEDTQQHKPVRFTGLVPPTGKRSSVAGHGPIRGYMPSFAGWKDSSDGGAEAAARRSVGGANSGGGSRRGTKEQLERWSEVQRRLSQKRQSFAGSGSSSRRSSASSGSSMAAAIRQLPDGMRRAMQRVSMT